jgi:5-methylcytosine-specific restriction endonuclease McrA
MKRVDPYYRTREWRELRERILHRDRNRCVICGDTARVVDHITPRRQGGLDHQANLRSLCRRHDNEVKESGFGKRRGTGFSGHRADGMPLDPNHPWNKE